MKISRGFRFRLYASAEQESLFARFAGTCRFVYNLALEQRRNFWRQFKANEGRPISTASQNKDLTALRAEVEWIAEAPVDCLQYALRDLNQAYAPKRRHPILSQAGQSASIDPIS